MRPHIQTFVVVALAAWWFAAPARAAGTDCDGWFSIRAQVVQIKPRAAALAKQLRGGREQRIKVNDFICAGESLILPAAGPVHEVILAASGRRVVVKPGQPFSTTGGVVAQSARGVRFVADFLAGVDGALEAQPYQVSPTGARGNDTRPADRALPVRPLLLLRDLPTQRIATDVAALVAWREGKGPYACEAMSASGDIVWRASAAEVVSWCELGPGAVAAIRIAIEDRQATSTGWNVVRIAPSEVPRPPWIPDDARAIPPSDATAWALWLWTSAGPQWRLQALAMWNRLAPADWLASYLRDSVLAESTLFSERRHDPQETP